MKSVLKNSKRALYVSLGAAMMVACVSPTGSQSDDESSAALRAGGNSAAANEKKTDICHIPPGNPANAHTINVGISAVQAHLAHGDVLGACADGGTTNPPTDNPPTNPPTDNGGGTDTPPVPEPM
jgi:hypothetical protein